MDTLNVIGCGSVGRTLARAWSQRGLLAVGGVLNRSPGSSRRAVDFIGAGRAVEAYGQLPPAGLAMISASDEAIAGCCAALCAAGMVGQGTVVFHCSGALSSDVLQPARQLGARTASLHPVKSFADPGAAVETFAGTFCALEGDPDACATLRALLEGCGARAFLIDPRAKPVYHAGTVFACNYLAALLAVGLKCLERAGVDRAAAPEVLRPIVAGTVENVFRLGPAQALTGPIARGEVSVVAREIEALGEWDPEVQRLYKALGRAAADLSSAKGAASQEALAAVRRLLK